MFEYDWKGLLASKLNQMVNTTNISSARHNKPSFLSCTVKTVIWRSQNLQQVKGTPSQLKHEKQALQECKQLQQKKSNINAI